MKKQLLRTEASAEPDATSRVELTDVPSPRTLLEWNEYMASLGPRHTGNAAHRGFIDFLAQRFEDLGMRVGRETQSFDRWEADSWSLALIDGSVGTPVDVAAYYPYSGDTDGDGIAAELVEAGTGDASSLQGRDVRGKIVLIEQHADGSLQAALGRLESMSAQLGVAPPHIPDEFQDWRSSVRHAIGADPEAISFEENATAELVFTAADLRPAKEAGAAGAVVIVEGLSADNLRGQYVPFMSPIEDLPALYVDSDTGRVLREAARGGGSARLTLTATRDRGATDQLVCALLGATDEVILVESHTDGPNVFEENGALGVLAIATALSRVPQAERRRTVVFVLATGHFVGGVRSADFYVEGNRDVIEKAVAAVVVEHLGATEWIDDGDGYRPTGKVEQAMCMVSDRPALIDEAVAALEAEGVTNTLFATPFAGQLFFGEGGAFDRAGIPTVGYIPLPNYLCAWGPNDHLDKFDADRMHAEVRALTRLVRRLDARTADDLRRA